mgnify:CR=1 FL=1
MTGADSRGIAPTIEMLFSGGLPLWFKAYDGSVAGDPARPPAGTTHVVLDTPAGLHGKLLERVLKPVRRVIVPVQPSLFDILATRSFLAELLAEKAVRKEKTFVAVVGMRVDARTRAAGELERFLEQYELPVLAYPRDTQAYVVMAGLGRSLFDYHSLQVRDHQQDWQPLLAWLDAV